MNAPAAKSKPEVVLLTGCSGLLGHQLLNELMAQSSIRKIICVAVRRLSHRLETKQLPIHYVSSAGVALFAELDAFPPISCTSTGKTPPADGSHGYMCGKWVCATMLERVHAKYGLRFVIQRPSTIIRAGDDAEAERASFDWVNALLHYAHKTQTVPRVDHNGGAFDLVSIEMCCNDTIRELLRDGPRDEGITYVNNVGDVIIPMAQMADIGLEKIGRAYRVLPMEARTKVVVKAGLHPAVAALIETFNKPGDKKYSTLLKT
ncbi:polyketide synthase [Colletotrichum higginsianum]|nr:polyketide synthase [Colletotrichum higginsianum]